MLGERLCLRAGSDVLNVNICSVTLYSVNTV